MIGEDHLEQILSKFDRHAVRYTQATLADAELADCMIIDCYGLLSSIYRYGEVASVGGGVGGGIHDVLEAAVWCMPVIFGPNNKRFQEAQELLAAEGGFEINGFDQFSQLMNRFMTDDAFLQKSGEAAGNYVKGRSGAADRILSEVGL